MIAIRSPLPIRARVLALLVGAALLAAVPLYAFASRAAYAQTSAQTWEVQVGAATSGMAMSGGTMESGMMHDPDMGPILAHAFFPSPLSIHVGDTVTWKWPTANAPHTVTFNSGMPNPVDVVPGPQPGEMTIGPAFFPINVTGNSSTFDGTQQVSSGVPRAPEGATFSLTFTQPGVFGYVCAVHPGMRAEINVHPSSVALSESPEQATVRGQVTADALLTMMKTTASQVRGGSAAGVHTVAAGVGNGFNVSALRFVPGNVTVRRGELVAWTGADPMEIHTVTFTSGAELPQFVEVRPQPQGPPQVVIPAVVASPSLTSPTYTGQGYANSGLLTVGSGYVLRFDAPPGEYMYQCLLHPSMLGKITITS